MPTCSIKNCKSWNMRKNFDENIKFFTFPKDPDIRKAWVKACGKKYVNFKSGRICSLHFTEEDWRLRDKLLNTSTKKRLLNLTAVPTKLLPDGVVLCSERDKRFIKRTSKKIVEEAILEYNLILPEQFDSQFDDSLNQANEEDNKKESLEVQTEIPLERARELQIIELEKKIKAVEKENIKIKEENSWPNNKT